MAGSIVVATAGRDEIVKYLQEKIKYFKLGEGGFLLSGLAAETIDAGAVGTENEYDYTILGGNFEIIGVSTVNDTFTIDDDFTLYFPVGTKFRVDDSVGNDGQWTVHAVSLAGGDTVIEVEEDVTDGTIGGIIYIDHLPIAKGPGTDSWHYPLRVVEYTPGLVEVQVLSDTTGLGNLTQTTPPGGLGTGTINYKNGELHAEFQNNVAVGNIVRVEFKYHDLRKSPSASRETLEADDAGIDLTGYELFSFQKYFGTDVNTRIDFVGIGTGKIKCYLYLAEWEGFEDGNLYGGVPFYYEGGLFDANDKMLGYFTFDKERKTGSATISHVVEIIV